MVGSYEEDTTVWVKGRPEVGLLGVLEALQEGCAEKRKWA